MCHVGDVTRFLGVEETIEPFDFAMWAHLTASDQRFSNAGALFLRPKHLPLKRFQSAAAFVSSVVMNFNRVSLMTRD